MDQAQAAEAYFVRNGFVAFSDFLDADTIAALRATADEAVEDGRLKLSDDDYSSNNDIVYCDPLFERLARHPLIVNMVHRLTAAPIELQHSKFNAKPLISSPLGEVAWHQDYPFYPHTNFDLVSCIIHLDDEGMDSGPVRMAPGSHRQGPLSHVEPDGRFAYRIVGCDDLRVEDAIPLQGKAGFVSFHHCLTVHCSEPKRATGHRRLIVFQYRAQDAVQMAGIVWRCNGMKVDDSPDDPRTARLASGITVELRGVGGRLVDMAGKFAPHRPNP